jgi:hypothetical protein
MARLREIEEHYGPNELRDDNKWQRQHAVKVAKAKLKARARAKADIRRWSTTLAKFRYVFTVAPGLPRC